MRRARSLYFLLGILAVFPAGCAGSREATEEPEPVMEEPMEPEEPMEEEVAEEPMAEEEIPADEPVAEQPMTEEELQAQRERELAAKAEYITLAERAYRAGDLRAARDAYRSALLLDPDDDAVRDRYNRVLTELGERAPFAEEVVTGEAAAAQARREQMRVEIQRRLNFARQAEAEGDYDAAVRYYEEILNLLNWYPYQADFPISAEEARARIDRARARADEQEARAVQEQLRRIQQQEEERRERQRTEEMRRMRIFLELANDAYDRGEYELAIANARKVLALDPNNEPAQELIRIARDTKYTSDRLELKQKFNNEWRTVMEQLEYDALPHPEILNFPDNWSEIAQRTPPRTGQGIAMEQDPREQQILNSLETMRVTEIDFEGGDITLEGAIGYLRSVTGENFVLSQRVREEMGDTPVQLKVEDVSVRQVLDLITTPNELAWRIRNGVVMILHREEAVDRVLLQFYDVKDLVAKIADFPGEDVNLIPSKYQPPDPFDMDDEPTSPFEVDQLIEVIQQTIEPESWQGGVPDALIEPKNNVLIVKTTPEIHARVGQFLDDLRRHTGLLVSLEVRFLTAEDRFLRDVGVDIRGLGDQTGGVGLPGKGSGTNFDDSFAGSPANPQGGPPGVNPEPSSIGTARTPGVFYGDGEDGEYKGRVENLFDFVLDFDQPGTATASAAAGGRRGANSGGFTLQHTFLDDTQMEVILRAVEKSERIEQISAPRLTVYDTQRANVSVMTQNSYVQDFDVEIAQAAAIGDPIIQTIKDGIILDVRPIVSADRRFITMELRPTVADLVRPIPTFQTSLATGPPVTIQVPEISISRVRTTVTMPDGGTLLLGGIKFFRDLRAESGVPVLSKIPVVSFLFSRKAKTIQRRNLLILIRAEVVILEERAPDLGFR